MQRSTVAVNSVNSDVRISMRVLSFGSGIIVHNGMSGLQGPKPKYKRFHAGCRECTSEDNLGCGRQARAAIYVMGITMRSCILDLELPYVFQDVIDAAPGLYTLAGQEKDLLLSSITTTVLLTISAK